MPEVEVTEIDALETARVDAVVTPASGIPFLMLKSLAKELDGEQTQDERYEKVNAALKIDVFGDADDLDERWLYIRDLSDTRLVYRDPEDESILWKREYSMTDGDDPVVTFGDKVQVVEEYKEVGDDGGGDSAGDAAKAGADAAADAELEAKKADGAGADMGDGTTVDGDDLDDTPGAPGSPEWEAADAEALTAVATELARLAARLGISLDRERMEYSAGEADDWRDIDAVSYAVDCVNTALNLVAGLSFREAVEGETEAAEKSIRPDLTDSFIKARDALSVLLGDTPPEEAPMDLSNVTELIKSATADDATDEDKAQLDELRKALGVATEEEIDAKVTKSRESSEERIVALEAELEEVKKAAAPGGPVKTRTSEQQDSADKVSELQMLKARRADLQEQFVKSTDPGWSEVLRSNVHDLDEQIATATAAATT